MSRYYGCPLSDQECGCDASESSFCEHRLKASSGEGKGQGEQTKQFCVICKSLIAEGNEYCDECFESVEPLSSQQQEGEFEKIVEKYPILQRNPPASLTPMVCDGEKWIQTGEKIIPSSEYKAVELIEQTTGLRGYANQHVKLREGIEGLYDEISHLEEQLAALQEYKETHQLQSKYIAELEEKWADCQQQISVLQERVKGKDATIERMASRMAEMAGEQNP
jgi:DNA repair exonuclease SbcCD ATPase subunit